MVNFNSNFISLHREHVLFRFLFGKLVALGKLVVVSWQVSVVLLLKELQSFGVLSTVNDYRTLNPKIIW